VTYDLISKAYNHQSRSAVWTALH